VAVSVRVRNVLLITADQWRGDTLGAVGHACVATPHLDALAAEGALFERHYAVSAPCGPSRASLHTGLYLHNHRSVLNGTPLDARHSNMALEARRAGYAPTLFGYTDTSPDPAGLAPRDPRLFSYEGVLPGYEVGQLLLEDFLPWLAWLRGRGFAGPLSNPEIHMPADGRLGGPARYDAAQSPTAFIADAALDWIATRGTAPWFAHVAFLRPHPPWTAPPELLARYDPTRMPPPVRAASAAADAAVHPLMAAIQAHTRTRGFVPGIEGLARDLDAAQIAALRATYYALASEVDHHVGRLLAQLRDAGTLDDTLVIFTADHGECLGDHHLLGKRGHVDEAFHVPLIVRLPGGARGVRVDAFTEAVDILPTVLEAIDVETPIACDGAALTPFLLGATPPAWRDAAHWEVDFRDLLAVAGGALGTDPDAASLVVHRARDVEYVHFAAQPPLLFDLAADPLRRRNLAAAPEHVAMRARCLDAVLTWRLRHEDRRLSNFRVTERGLVRWR
jgi:arylsulfatase A-like enzyme